MQAEIIKKMPRKSALHAREPLVVLSPMAMVEECQPLTKTQWWLWLWPLPRRPVRGSCGDTEILTFLMSWEFSLRPNSCASNIPHLLWDGGWR